MTDDYDMTDILLYSRAYGMASRALERFTTLKRFTRLRRRPDPEAERRRIEAEVARELGDRDGRARQIIREAVKDATENRRPRR